MKITLSLELDTSILEELKEKVSEDDLKEELTQMLFEVCEDWVIKGQEPDLEFSNEKSKGKRRNS